MNKTLHTKYGTAKINNIGYYQITTWKKSNHGKLLHRLIAEDYFGEWINDTDPNGNKWHIHHIDGDKTNNCVLNLEPIPERDHNLLHKSGENHPNYGKIGYWKDKTLSDEHKQKISKTKNTSGYLNVYKQKNKNYKQGFRWCYQYSEDGKQKSIASVDINKLEQKVKNKGLEWREI